MQPIFKYNLPLWAFEQNSSFRTKNRVFEQKIESSNKKLSFRTKNWDFEQNLSAPSLIHTNASTTKRPSLPSRWGKTILCWTSLPERSWDLTHTKNSRKNCRKKIVLQIKIVEKKLFCNQNGVLRWVLRGQFEGTKAVVRFAHNRGLHQWIGTTVVKFNFVLTYDLYILRCPKVQRQWKCCHLYVLNVCRKGEPPGAACVPLKLKLTIGLL
jgi:hypothetical protein